MEENQNVNSNPVGGQTVNTTFPLPETPVHHHSKKKIFVTIAILVILSFSGVLFLVYWYSPGRMLDKATDKISQVYKDCSGDLNSEMCQNAISQCSNDPRCQSQVSDQNSLRRGSGTALDSQIYYDTAVQYVKIKRTLEGE